MALDQISLVPISCGSALDAPPLAAWVRCRCFTRSFYNEENDSFPQIKVGQLKSLPIPFVEGSRLKAIHDTIASLVEKILSLNRQLPDVTTPHEQTALERQIEATDRQIDAMVYELYGLTEEEIAIVEGRG